MVRKKTFTATALALCASLTFLAATVPADSVTIGTPGGGGTNQDCVPFGCGTMEQFVYDASFFSGPITIDTITFYNSVPESPDTFDPATYTFKLSTTSRSDVSLSSVFADNVGPDEALFTTVVVGSDPIPATFSFSGTPFTYDPSAGNLLLEISKPDGTDSFSAFTDNSASLAGVARVWNGDGGPTGSVDRNYAPVVTFSGTAAVPEPATLTLAGLGLVSFAGAAAAKRRKKA